MTSDPAAVSMGPDRNDVLTIRDDGSVRHFTLNGSEYRESNIPDAPDDLVGNPVLCSWGQFRLDAFVRDARDSLWHNAWDGEWSGWTSVASVGVSADPAVVSWGTGRFDLYTRTTAGLLDHHWYHHPLGLNGPDGMGGPIAGRPAAVTTSLYGTQVVVRGADDGLLRRQYHVPDQRSHEWTSTTWQPARGRFLVGPQSVACNGDSLACTDDPVLVWCRGEGRVENRLLGYARQGDRLVQVEPMTWQQDPRDRLLEDPIVSSDLAVVSMRSRRIDGFAAIGPDTGTVGWVDVELTEDGGSDTRWRVLDDGHTAASGRPAVTSTRPGRLDLYFRSADGRLCHGYWEDAADRWNVR
ncbi:hypothetical protein [Streptosporangium sp. NPDC000509]|uniref:hypothetical protein n=1 Tax=Streptosporangium sp. NPDC000509 TaxID=3366186 RepID=UPI0036B74C93